MVKKGVWKPGYTRRRVSVWIPWKSLLLGRGVKVIRFVQQMSSRWLLLSISLSKSVWVVDRVVLERNSRLVS